MERTYKWIRQLAITDFKRRLSSLNGKLGEWGIVSDVKDNGKIEKRLIMSLDNVKVINLTMNEYATLREMKYIVWRFELSEEEVQ